MAEVNVRLDASASNYAYLPSAAYIPWSPNTSPHTLSLSLYYLLVPPSDPPHQANFLSCVFAQKHWVTAASVSQLRLHGTPFPKTYMIAQSLCQNSRVCWRHTYFVPSFTVAEKRVACSAEFASAFWGTIQDFRYFILFFKIMAG